MPIELAEDDDTLLRCWPVMRQLRPHLSDAAAFLVQVRLQQREGYRLACLTDEASEIRALAGFRILTTLGHGRKLYVDDLVTREDSRSAGHGQNLFAWLVQRAGSEGCAQLELDSGVGRHGAHRFYLRQRMDIAGFHFRLPLQ